jgi:hypothetical protein
VQVTVEAHHRAGHPQRRVTRGVKRRGEVARAVGAGVVGASGGPGEHDPGPGGRRTGQQVGQEGRLLDGVEAVGHHDAVVTVVEHGRAHAPGQHEHRRGRHVEGRFGEHVDGVDVPGVAAGRQGVEQFRGLEQALPSVGDHVTGGDQQDAGHQGAAPGTTPESLASSRTIHSSAGSLPMPSPPRMPSPSSCSSSASRMCSVPM